MFKLPNKIKQDLPAYETVIRDFLEGRSSWARFSGIRVPWGNYSHRGGKVFMCRVRLPAGVVSPVQLQALADASILYGDGILHITTRQDIQIHNIKLEDIIKVHNLLKEHELSSRGGGGNTVRNITACPLAGICKEETFDVREDAISLTEYLIADDTSYNLPRKFKIAFSGCLIDCAGCLVNDVGLLATKKDSLLGYKVFCGGGMGAVSCKAKLLEEFIERKDLGYVITAIRNVFYKYGDRKNKHHNRLRFLIQDLGFEKFKEYYQKELKELKENEYISLRKIEFNYPLSKSITLKENNDNEFKKFLKYNCQPQKQDGFLIVKLRIPRGDLKSDIAKKLVGIVEGLSFVEFRTTREQNLYIVNVDADQIYNLYLKLKNLLLDFLYPNTLLDIVACKGSTTCNLGLCNSPALAKELEEMIKNNFLNKKVFERIKIKINGCPNACGQHPIGLISFCGAVRKIKTRPVPFYKLFLGGKVDLENTHLAFDTGILIPAKNVPLFLKDFLETIENKIDKDIDIYEFIEKEAKAIAEEIADRYSYVPDYSENKDFYIDWGKTEEFSLAGLGPGECGAGVLDMIESDLAEAKIELESAEKENYSAERIKKALFLASRSLLVVRGKDPRNETEALNDFYEEFIQTSLCHQDYTHIQDVFKMINEQLNLQQRKEKFLYAQGFLNEINRLYAMMDASFNFPQQKKNAEITKEKPGYFLDLRGTPCPLNYVKTKLFLENLQSGEILEVLLDEGEPIDNVPRSLEADGHRVINIEKKDSFFSVLVKKELR
ncbi:MAG: sulfurtransferase TusA family protein [Candidatus Omnitrophica bacterium]|nr:sulfurtransferase TusA family protein [Candidatus Omnitrophota bacterium]